MAQTRDAGLLNEDEVYELLAFLVTSAELLVAEPRLYGTGRLMDAASRMMGFVLESRETHDEFLRQFKLYIDESMSLLISDEEAYIEFLREASRTLARELIQRASKRDNGRPLAN